MSDLIDREQAIDALVAETIYTEEELKEYYEANSHRDEWVNGIYEAIERIKQLPPIQPKRGKWLLTSDDNKKRCSECDVITLIAQYPFGEANFCPNCGADMRQGEQDG